MTPPLSPIALWLLTRLVPILWRDSVEGDLVEEHARRRRAGRRAGTLWQLGFVAAVGARLRLEARLSSAPVSSHHGGTYVMDAFFLDVRHAVRGLVKNRGYAALAVLTLAIGIGANAAVFNVANWLMYRPVPGIADPGSLIGITLTRNDGVAASTISLANIERLRSGTPAVDGIAGLNSIAALNVAVDGRAPQRLDADLVTGNYFDVLGVRLTAGRGFSEDEGTDPGMPPVAVISERARRSFFDTPEAALGQTMTINGKAVAIVGVAPDGFHGARLLGGVDVWMPGAQRYVAYPADPPTPLENQRASMFFHLAARLRPGQTLDAVNEQMRAVAAEILAENPSNERFKTNYFRAASDAGAFDFSDSRRGRKTLTETFAMLLALSGLLLLLACANVSNSVLARATSRAGEIATRLALGASRLAVARMLFVESLLLSVFAGVAALLLAGLVARALEGTVVLPGVPPLGRALIEWRVIAWGIGLATVTAVVTSLTPMWSARRASPILTMRRSGASGTGRRRLRMGLTAIQVAMSLVLVVGGALLGRSIVAKLATDPGFDASRVLTFSLQPASADSRPPDVLHQQLLNGMRAVPGVRAVSLSFLPPYYSGNEQRLTFRVDAAAENTAVALNPVKPGFFDAIGVPFIDGRDFTDADLDTTRPANQGPVIVNESLARRVFGTASVAGQTILTGTAGVPRTIVGVIRDTRQRRLIGDDAGDIAFAPLRADTWLPWITVVLGTSAPPNVVLPAARQAVADVDPTLPIFRVSTAHDGFRAEVGEDLLATRIVIAFAGLAVVIAAIGLYAVLARTVGERSREVGIRTALGATSSHVVRLITREIAIALLIGVTAGALASAWLTRFVESRLFGISPFDTASFAGAVLLVVIVMALSALPACLRATRLSPAATLKE